MEWVDLQLQCLDGYELHTVIMPRTAQEAGARRSFNGFVGVKSAIGCLISLLTPFHLMMMAHRICRHTSPVGEKTQ